MKHFLIFGAAGLLGQACCEDLIEEDSKNLVFGFDSKAVSSESLIRNPRYFHFLGDGLNENDLESFRQLMLTNVSSQSKLKGILNATWAPEVKLLEFGANNATQQKSNERNIEIVRQVIEMKTEHFVGEISQDISIMHNLMRIFGSAIINSADCSVVVYSSQYASFPPNQDLFTNLGRFVMKLPGYSVSKAALEMYVKYLASVFGKINTNENNSIRFNCISPGHIDNGQSETFKNNYKDKSTMPNLIPLQDVVDLTLYMLSDKSRYITGSVYSLDGGWSLS